MSNREARVDPPRVVPAIADEDALSVGDLPGLARVVEEGGSVLEANGKGGRELSRRSRIAEEDRGGGVCHLLAAQPDVEDRRDARSTHGIAIGAPAFSATTVLSIDGRDALDELRLGPGRSIDSRSCPSVSHSSLVPTTARTTASARAAARTARSSRVVGGQARRQPQHRPAEVGRSLVRVLEEDLAGLPRDEVDARDDLFGPEAEERVAARQVAARAAEAAARPPRAPLRRKA